MRPIDVVASALEKAGWSDKVYACRLCPRRSSMMMAGMMMTQATLLLWFFLLLARHCCFIPRQCFFCGLLCDIL